ncbi:MAG: hypothetical protein IJ849_04225 [Selenomonadaceae bacterium]|nr:hypothetical protein [Selenomonadaceae bacterium]
MTKTYDGTEDVTSAITVPTLYGVVSDDTNSVTATATGTYADKNVGTGKTVNYTLTLSGAKSGNYSLATAATGSGDITAKELTLKGNDVTWDKYSGGDFPTSFSGTATGLIDGDGVPIWTTIATQDSAVGEYDITTDFTNANYKITGYPPGKLTITDSTPTPEPTPTPTPEPTPEPTPKSEPMAAVENRLEEVGVTVSQMEAVVSVAAAPVTPVSVAPATVAESGGDNTEDSGEATDTAATTATTSGDATDANPNSPTSAVNTGAPMTWNGHGILKIENEGVKAPRSMSAEEVAAGQRSSEPNVDQQGDEEEE